MICASTHNANGVVYIVQQEPQPADVSMCPLVIANVGEIGQNPFSLTLDQGVQIGGAILFVWAIAWIFRALLKALSTDVPEEE